MNRTQRSGTRGPPRKIRRGEMDIKDLKAIAYILGCGEEFDAVLSGKSLEDAIKEKAEYIFGGSDEQERT